MTFVFGWPRRDATTPSMNATTATAARTKYETTRLPKLVSRNPIHMYHRRHDIRKARRAVAPGGCREHSFGAFLHPMTDLPQRALALAGFVLAHAAWSLSDGVDGDLLCPLTVVESGNGERTLARYEAESQEVAIIAGKSAMRDVKNEAAAWAFAREGAWRKMGSEQAGDVLAVDFWAAGMPSTATFMQPFSRARNGSRFRIGGVPTLVVGDRLLSADVASPSITAIMDGVNAHTIVAGLWPTWR